jgi:hypothetical protein
MVNAAPAGRYPALDNALLSFGGRVDEVRQQLYYCDVDFLRKETRFPRQSIRASVYVHLAAALEAYVYATTESLSAEISAANVKLAGLRLSLFAISSGPGFSALGDLRGLKNWERRCEVLEAIDSISRVHLDSTHLPLDGRTIRPEHLQAIWRVFGLPGLPLPGSIHALALRDLADSRNDVAHGNEPLAVVAGRKSPADMLRLVGRIEEIGINLFSSATEYLDAAMYRR